jgi:hypothetical protein
MFVTKLLEPTPGKLLIFSFMVVLIMIIPLYPVKVEVTNAIGNYGSVTTYENEPLALILIRGYEWTEVGIVITSVNYGTMWGMPPMAIMEYSADPGFMPFYNFLIIFAYVFSCFIIERAKWQWKGRFIPYSKNV